MGIRTVVLAFAVIVALGAGSAQAELTVTITITGGIDEVLPVLQYLSDLGIGTAPAEQDEEEGVRLEMHSVMAPEASTLGQGGEQTAAPATPPPPEPEPELGFSAVSIEPAVVRRGEMFLVTVRVGDPDKVVDTVAGTIQGHTFDLFDNKTHGDVKAGDGIWSGSLAVSQHALPPGEYAIEILAYDKNGDPVTKPDATGAPMALLTDAKVTLR